MSRDAVARRRSSWHHHAVTIHPNALAFANVAAAYERGRPDYPHELLDWMGQRGDLGADRCVVDLGAGTGKLSRLLVGHGARVIAVEPLAEMRAELEAIVPQAEVVAGNAESMPLGDGVVDVVTCGQSFHWFANDRALAEIARVLRPRGVLMLVWNNRDDSDPLQKRLSELVDPSRGETPSQSSFAWRDVLAAAPSFEAEGELKVTMSQLVDRAILLDRVESMSFVAALAGPRRVELLAEVASLVPVLGSVELRYITEAYAYRRRDGKMAS